MKIHWHKSLASTNDEAKKLAAGGAEHGTLVGADFQEKGRGRGGHRWDCAPGEGLLCSLILHPRWEKEYWGWVALTAGLALAELLERDCLQPRIKYPNDVLVNEKKIAGILTEADESYVVVGIGMNLNMSRPPEVESSAVLPTSFFLETDCKLDARSYAESVQGTLLGLLSAESPLLLRSAITRKLAWLGEHVSTGKEEALQTGEIIGLGDHGQLLLKSGSECAEIYNAEHLRKVRAAQYKTYFPMQN